MGLNKIWYGFKQNLKLVRDSDINAVLSTYNNTGRQRAKLNLNMISYVVHHATPSTRTS